VSPEGGERKKAGKVGSGERKSWSPKGRANLPDQALVDEEGKRETFHGLEGGGVREKRQEFDR